jgi:hypothetical protein
MPIELQAISENRHVLVTTVLTPVRVYKPRSCVCTPITSIGTQASGQRPGSRRVMGSMGALTGAAGLRYLEYSTGGGGGGAGGEDVNLCVCAVMMCTQPERGDAGGVGGGGHS